MLQIRYNNLTLTRFCNIITLYRHIIIIISITIISCFETRNLPAGISTPVMSQKVGFFWVCYLQCIVFPTGLQFHEASTIIADATRRYCYSGKKDFRDLQSFQFENDDDFLECQGGTTFWPNLHNFGVGTQGDSNEYWRALLKIQTEEEVARFDSFFKEGIDCYIICADDHASGRDEHYVTRERRICAKKGRIERRKKEKKTKKRKVLDRIGFGKRLNVLRIFALHFWQTLCCFLMYGRMGCICKTWITKPRIWTHCER